VSVCVWFWVGLCDGLWYECGSRWVEGRVQRDIDLIDLQRCERQRGYHVSETINLLYGIRRRLTSDCF
jgi:hypothetical protein